MEKKVLAKVEDTIITDEHLNILINQYPENKREYFKKEKGKKSLLDNIIKNELLYYYGKELNIDNNEEFKKEIERYSKELIIQIMMKKIIGNVDITEEYANEYYLLNQDKFIDGEKIAAKHILVETKEEALKIKQNIEENIISFEDAALKYSMCPSCMHGGSIGSFERGKMYPEIDEVAFSAEINKITNPVKTEMGFHLILVEDKKVARMRGFEEIKDYLIKKLKQEREQEKLIECIKALKKKFYINITL